MTMAAPGEPTSASLFNLGSIWTHEDEASVTLGALGGKPVVAAMGYTSCTDMCPAIIADMMGIEKESAPGASAHVRLAFFSTDSKAGCARETESLRGAAGRVNIAGGSGVTRSTKLTREACLDDRKLAAHRPATTSQQSPSRIGSLLGGASSLKNAADGGKLGLIVDSIRRISDSAMR